jgi:hypothetical protein
MAIEDIIAKAIADGAPEAEAMPAALRVKAALGGAGVLVALPPAYKPKEYPKWVAGKVVRNADEEAALTAPVVAEVVAPVVVAPVVVPEPAVVVPPVLDVVIPAPAEAAEPPVVAP